MAIKIGNIDISTVGKIKLGSTNVTKVYLGTTQIFPVGVTYYPFATSHYNSAEIVDACSSMLFSETLYTTNSNGIVNVGDIVYYLALDGLYYPWLDIDAPYISYNEGSIRKVILIGVEGDGYIYEKTTCGTSSFEYSVKLGSTDGNACAATTQTVYSGSNSFNTGMTLYTTSALTTPITGFEKVVLMPTADIYNINSTTGVVGSNTGAC
jgi:hypothetical protein